MTDAPRLSALVTGWPGNLALAARYVELFGYERLWVTEHHARDQSASPLLAAAVAAASTNRLRIGTAGVMLRYTSPLRLAKDTHFLDSVFPGRFEIGTIAGFASLPATHSALMGTQVPAVDDDESIDLLLRYLRHPQQSSDGEFANDTLHRGEAGVAAWMCSNKSARAAFAGRRGMGLVFHIPQAGDSGVELALRSACAYRTEFVPSPSMPEPKFAVVCSGICADSRSAAMRQWPVIVAASEALLPPHQLTRREIGDPPSHNFIGAPNECRRHIQELADALDASEIILHSAAESVAASLHGLGLLAGAFGLTAADALVAPGQAR